MKFILDTSGTFYSEKDKKRLEKLGFKFYIEPDIPSWLKDRPYRKYGQNIVEIEINSLEELIKFQNKWREIIIRDDYYEEKSNRKVIEIYDDYNRE